MTLFVEIQNELAYPVNEAQLRSAAQVVFEMHNIMSDRGMSIVITNNESVQTLNHQYRDIDAPTDVLSFPAEIPIFELTEDEQQTIGDLVIAFPYASQQAQMEGYSLNDNLALLVVHGTLHLLGYDHDMPQARAEMWDVQADALLRLNISPEIVPILEGTS